MNAVLLKVSDDTYREERKLTTLSEFVNLVEESMKRQKNGYGDVIVWIEDGVIYLEDHDGYVE